MHIFPYISVIVPTYARPLALQSCLKAFENLAYPGKWELIIVDDGSPERLDSIVEPFRQKMDLTLLRQLNAGPAAARNCRAAHARGDYIAFTDDDCSPEANWLMAIAERYSAEPQACIGGLTVNALQTNPLCAASQLLVDYMYAYSHPDKPGRFFASSNVAFPKKLFTEISGFDTSFPRAAAEDRDICRRWITAGLATVYAPEAVVWHEHHMDLSGFLRQHFNYGRGAFHYHAIKASELQKPLQVEPARFYADLPLIPFKTASNFHPLRLMFLLLLSQGANAAGFFLEWFSSIRQSIQSVYTANSR